MDIRRFYRGLGHRLMFWRWPDRFRCHGNTKCCQRTDRPNCNNPSAPKGLHHR